MADQPTGGLFRKEAMEAHYGRRGEGDPLRLAPRWTTWMFWLLAGSFLAAIAYSFVGTIDEHASGVAIVQVRGRTELTARAAGTVEAIDAKPGQRVRAGDVLVRFHADQAQLDSVEQQFQDELVKTLADPGDQGARAQLTALRAQRELLRKRFDESMVKAPTDGVVSDIRIRHGQLLQAGETVLSLVPDDAAFDVVAVLPGNFRPRLAPGMKMRIEMRGYHHAYREVTIDTIGDQVVGPAEIRRYLPKEIADTLPISGPVVLVTARLPSRSFEAQGKSYDYFDGMQGQAEARVGSETIIATLIPGLRGAF